MNLLPLKINKFYPIILLYGAERFIHDQYIDQLLNFLEPGYRDFNFDKLSNEDITIKRIKEISETLPLFGDKRILLLEDLELTKNKIQTQKDFLEDLQSYLPEIPSTTMIIVSSNNEKIFRGKFYKSIEKYGKIIACKKLEYSMLVKYIRHYLLKHSKNVQHNVLQQIIEYSHYLDGNMNMNLYDLNHELDKLIEYCGNRKISLKDIMDTMTKHYETNIFKLMDAISQRNNKNAMYNYHQLMKGQGDPFRIFYMILRQIRLILFIKELDRKKIIGETARKKLKISEFEYNKIRKYIQHWKYKQCYHGIHQGFVAEVQLKSIPIDEEIIVEKFLYELLRNEGEYS